MRRFRQVAAYLLTQVCLGGLALVLVLGPALVLLGVIEVRFPGRSSESRQRPQVSLPREERPHVRSVSVPLDLNFWGQRAYLFEYEGGYIDCWLEVKGRGQDGKLGIITAEQMRKAHGKGMEAKAPRGKILWVWGPGGKAVRDLVVSGVNGVGGESHLWQTGVNEQIAIREKAAEKAAKSGDELLTGVFGQQDLVLLSPNEPKCLVRHLGAVEVRLMCQLVHEPK